MGRGGAAAVAGTREIQDRTGRTGHPAVKLRRRPTGDCYFHTASQVVALFIPFGGHLATLSFSSHGSFQHAICNH